MSFTQYFLLSLLNESLPIFTKNDVFQNNNKLEGK